MRVTKEDAREALEILENDKGGIGAYLYHSLKDFLKKVERSLPSQAAVERDRQRGKKRQSAAQTG